MTKLITLSLFLAMGSLLFAVGGTEDQKGRISPAEVQVLLKNDRSVVLMDVRTPEEFAQGYIAGAKLLPYDQINAKSAATVIPTRDTTVVVYCRSGHRAGIAVQTLQRLGYTKVLNLGGIITWPYEIVKGPAPKA